MERTKKHQLTEFFPLRRNYSSRQVALDNLFEYSLGVGAALHNLSMGNKYTGKPAPTTLTVLAVAIVNQSDLMLRRDSANKTLYLEIN